MRQTCIQCGNEFELTNAEVDFYRKKNLQLPKRCKVCREKNKQQNGKPQMGSYTAGKGSGKGIVTAVAGIMLLLALFFGLKQTGILSDVRDNSSAVTGLQTAAPTPEAAPAGRQEEMRTPSSEPASTAQPTEAPASEPPEDTQPETVTYTFRSEKLLLEHYKKHGIEMGFDSAEAYAAAANLVIANPDALHKLEAEDGDDVYYLEETNEFVIVSTDGYIRTYFNPSGGIDYYNRQ